MQNISKKTPLYLLIILAISIGIYLIYTNDIIKNQNREEASEEEIEINQELFDKYSKYVLDVYDLEVPNDEYHAELLKDVSDIVKTYDTSNLGEILPSTQLPEVDLKETEIFSYYIDSKERIDIKYVKPEGYSTPYSQIYLTGEALFKGVKISDIQIRERGDFKGELSLQIFNNAQLKYPIQVIGQEMVASNRDEKGIYFLINGELVRYQITWDEDTIQETFRSTLDVDIYIDNQDNKPYIYSYWEDPAFVGLKITKWSINHEEKQIEKDSSVIEVERE